MAGALFPEQECMMSFFHTAGARAILGDDESVVGLFGLADGMIWLLGTDGLTGTKSHRRQLARGGRQWVDELRQKGEEAHNWAFSANSVAIQWLKSLGFTVHQPAPHGPYGMLFSYFELEL